MSKKSKTYEWDKARDGRDDFQESLSAEERHCESCGDEIDDFSECLCSNEDRKIHVNEEGTRVSGRLGAKSTSEGEYISDPQGIMESASVRTSSARLQQLSEHPSTEIRKQVASNPMTSDEVLAKLGMDNDRDVSEAARDAQRRNREARR
jgi:hypothetical protein